MRLRGLDDGGGRREERRAHSSRAKVPGAPSNTAFLIWQTWLDWCAISTTSFCYSVNLMSASDVEPENVDTLQGASNMERSLAAGVIGMLTDVRR